MFVFLAWIVPIQKVRVFPENGYAWHCQKNLTPKRPKTRIAVDFLPCSGALCTEEGEISDKVIGS